MGVAAKAPMPVKRAVRSARRVRRSAFEAFGSDRYSAVAVGGMDRALAELLGRDGTFLEAGANDGIRYSNTYLLERFYGWRGVLVEAVPGLYRDCVRNRPQAQVFQAALGRPGEKVVRIDDRDLESCRCDDGQPLPARTISSVLDEAAIGTLTLLSLDLEGYEPAALEGLDLGRHAPHYLLFEAHDFDQQRSHFEQLLCGRYELLRRFGDVDVLYRLVRGDLDAADADAGE